MELPDDTDYTCTMQEASLDTDKNQTMTDRKIKVFRFDDIKDWYVKKAIPKVNPEPKSNDALWITEQGSTFIEFKNGKIDSVMNCEIIEKIYDSLLILFDISNILDGDRNISYTREHMDYVLVYNPECIKTETKQDQKGKDRQLQESTSREIIGKLVNKRANQSYIKFGLDKFRGYLFREVYTLSPGEFEKFVQKRVGGNGK